jgi:hypothetical protein
MIRDSTRNVLLAAGGVHALHLVLLGILAERLDFCSRSIPGTHRAALSAGQPGNCHSFPGNERQ